MDDARLGRTVRVLRQRRGWRQLDLAAAAGVSDTTVSNIERGRTGMYTVDTMRRVLRALGASADLAPVWGGPGELDRLLDRQHAALVEAWMGRHRPHGWELWPEASYSIFGERGRIDLLAYHAASSTLEVAECKTDIWNLQDTLGKLDAKVRLGPDVARVRGWASRHTVAALVLAEGRSARRRVQEFPHLFDRFDCRGVAASAFVRAPTPAAHGLLAFVSLPRSHHAGLRRAGQLRVRAARARPGLGTSNPPA